MTTNNDAPAPKADVLTKALPALSATTDMPVVTPPADDAAAKAAADKTAADKAAADKAAADAKAAAEKTGDQTDKGDGKTKDGIKERFSDMAAKRRAAEERAATEESARKAAEAKADKLAAELEGINKRLDRMAPPDPADVRPDRKDFDDPAKYDEALIGWSARTAEKKAKAEAEAEFANKTEAEKRAAAEAAQKAEAERVAKDWNERSAKFAEETPDFHEAISNDAVKITGYMAQAMTYSEMGPKIAYHLAKNPAEAERISALNPMQQVAAIGRLEAQLNVPPKTTRTPDPISPITSNRSSAATTKSADEMSMDEYAARRHSEMAEARKNGTRR